MYNEKILLIDTYDARGKDANGNEYAMSFRLRFMLQTNRAIRIDILSQPPYKRHQAQGGHATHRYGLPDHPYICYEPMPTNLRDAKIIAAEWANRTAYYIKTGRWLKEGEWSL